jgi:FkbM family methyltransferase
MTVKDLDISTKVEPLLPEIRDKDPVPGELRDGDIVIEAGAYEGRWVKKVCEQLNCTVYAFEPATRAYEMAQEKLGGYSNVTLRCFALGRQTGTTTLYDCDRDGANTLNEVEGEPSETVPMVDVAEVVEPLGEIALMHLNAEGGEIEILERLVETGLIERVRMILVQWHRPNDQMRAWVSALIERLSETHEFERRYYWGCWKRKNSADAESTKKETVCL